MQRIASSQMPARPADKTMTLPPAGPPMETEDGIFTCNTKTPCTCERALVLALAAPHRVAVLSQLHLRAYVVTGMVTHVDEARRGRRV